jgi:hypothetical protein
MTRFGQSSAFTRSEFGLPTQTGWSRNSDQRRFMESPLFLSDLLTGHGPRHGGVPGLAGRSGRFEPPGELLDLELVEPRDDEVGSGQ